MPFQVVFVVFDGITQLDFCGPAQVLSRAPDAQVHVAAKGLGPVKTDCGFTIGPTTTFTDCPQADLICVPGGFGVVDALGDAMLLEFLNRQVEGAQYVTSVCTGALLLGAVGALQGKRAATHWAYTDLLATCGAAHEPGRVVVDGKLITGGGVTAGLDFAFTVLERVAGAEAAQSVQLALEYDPQPPFETGHPTRAPEALLQRVQARYAQPVARTRHALEAALTVQS